MSMINNAHAVPLKAMRVTRTTQFNCGCMVVVGGRIVSDESTSLAFCKLHERADLILDLLLQIQRRVVLPIEFRMDLQSLVSGL